jgi:hypothetical protein
MLGIVSSFVSFQGRRPVVQLLHPYERPAGWEDNHSAKCRRKHCVTANAIWRAFPYLSDYSLNLEYDKITADYSKGKNEVVFVIIPYLEDFQNAFTFYDGNIYIDTEAEISNVSKSNLTIFLVDNGEKYHIVAWAENAEFFKFQKQILHGDFGGLDFSYRIWTLRDNVKILFDTTCTYAICKKAFPASLETDKFIIYDITSDVIQEDLKYVNSYCEGFYELGMAPFATEKAAPYLQLAYKELYAIAVNEVGFRGVVNGKIKYTLFSQ